MIFISLIVSSALAFTTFPLTKIEFSEIQLLNSSSITNYWNAQYYLTLYIGRPPQKTTLILDTGSSWLWTPSKNSNCHQSKNRFDSSASSSFLSDKESKEIHYGRGYVKGYISEDTFYLNELTANSQTFILATEDSDLDGLKSDGVFGLGFNSLSDGHPTLIETLKQNGEIENAIFSIYFTNAQDSNQGSLLTIGGFDSDYFTGE